MDYQNTLKYLYESVPMFQQVGKEAYKPGLETTQKLDEYFGHPHQQFKTIHIAGTKLRHIILGTKNTRNDNLMQRNALDLQRIEISPTSVS